MHIYLVESVDFHDVHYEYPYEAVVIASSEHEAIEVARLWGDSTAKRIGVADESVEKGVVCTATKM